MELVPTAVEAAIGWVVQSILGSFFTRQMQRWTCQVGLAKDVEELESEMKSMQMVLAAAEKGKIDNRPLSKSLDGLKELLYDAEDVMDELDYYRLQQQIEVEGKGSSAAAYTNPEGSCASLSTPSYFQRVSNSIHDNISLIMHGKKRKREAEEEPTHTTILPYEIKHDICERINEIVNNLRIWRKPVQEVLQLEILRQIAMPKQSQSELRNPRLTTSLPIERKVYGRDAERDTIIELLTRGRSSELGVLPLVGIGGVGKTTLARFVYRDQRIKDHFTLRMWICVSNNFNERNLTREMLELACEGKEEYKNITSFDLLQETLLNKIMHKRFLLVLDDMWQDTKRNRWDKLLVPLKCNEATGCMILATTRRTSVARMIGTMSKVDVNGLDEIEFWLLFKAWAFFGNEKLESDPTLQFIGQNIAKTLKGNPLAARSVGALLNSNLSFEHWREVQYRWRSLPEQDDDILSILKLSYEFLPVHLQHCFSYCSLFPKDHQFNGENLVQAWISQNFVNCECDTERLDETGKQYLDNLVDWGFFEKVGSKYVMHDLMHDLAEKVSQNECAIVDGSQSKKISPDVRHLSIITTAYDGVKPCDFPSEKFEIILESTRSMQKLRTLMFFGENSIMLLSSLRTLCKDSKSLRLLKIYVTATNISSTHNFLTPHHLRYLELIVVPTKDLSGYDEIINTSIPQVLTQFYHLQLLYITSEGNLVVPIGMNNLVNLRHLIAPEKVYSAIAGVGNLTSLQELAFNVQDADNFNIGQLQSMNELVRLKISQLENVKTKEDAKSARLIDKEHLEVLLLSWNGNSMSPVSTAEETRDDVLEGLEPPPSLKHLELTQYGGATSPTWLATGVNSLQTLHLENCREWRIVQSLEMLPLLKKLKLIRMWNLMEVSIPSNLEQLVLVNMPKLEKCVGTYGQDLTSCLRVLMVKDCPQLKEFVLFHNDYFHVEQKSWFPSLNKLTIGHCHQIIVWKVLPLEEMRALKELELMDVPVVEELLVPCLEKLVLIKMPSLQSCSGVTTSKAMGFSTNHEEEKEWVSGLCRLTIRDCSNLVVSHALPSPLISDLSIKGLSTIPTMKIYKKTFTIESNELSELDGRILPFHNLKGITSMKLQNCSNLTCISSESLSQLIALEHLVIDDCPNLHLMPEIIQENSMSTTNVLVLPSLKSLSILSSGITGRWLTQLLQHLQSLEYLELHDCPQIKILSTSQPTEMEETSSLATGATASAFAKDEQHLLMPCNLVRSLKRLDISECQDMEFCRGDEGFGGYISLVKLSISSCPKLASLLVSKMDDIRLLPTSLQDLEISPLPANLKSYSLKGLPCLKNLRLLDGLYLKFVRLHSCTALENLVIMDCQVGILDGLQHLNSLRTLFVSISAELYDSWDLKLTEQQQSSNHDRLLPLSLRELGIANLERDLHFHSVPCLPSVTKLSLWNNPKLTSVWLGDCVALEELEIYMCNSLASIDGFQSIRNLRSLKIYKSPNLSQYLQLLSQQQGASAIWSRLEILNTDDSSVLSMALCKQLTSLRCLLLGAHRQLPTTVVSLTEEEERALQLLTSLRELSFHYCQNLESLPSNLRNLDSLRGLYITGCPRIQRLPKMGLPRSLRFLILDSCSEELSMQCRMAETENLRVWYDYEH